MTGNGVDTEALVEELTKGRGFVLLEGHFSRDVVAEARAETYRLAREEPDRTSHFLGKDNVVTQKRVWNLIEKSSIYRKLAADPTTLDIIAPIVGDDLQLASFAANVLHPGAPAQEGHVDYPYWDLHERKHFPRTLNASFFLEVETLIMLDDFTIENGATALVPGSQLRARWPTKEEFAREQIRVAGPAGSLLLFPALTWHAGQANRSNGTRAAVLGCYTSKFVRPLEDWHHGLSAATKAQCEPRLRELLMLDYPYPAVMDELEARSSEGTESDRIGRAYN